MSVMSPTAASPKPSGSLIFPLLFACMLWPPASFAAEKTISVEQQHRDDPVLIYSVSVGNLQIGSGLVDGVAGYQPIVPFEAGADWLQNTTVSILNRTNKTIVYGSIALMFPETGDGTMQKPIATYNLTFGRIPDSAAFTASGQVLVQRTTAPPAAFGPGQTMTLRLADQITSIEGTVISIPFSAVTKCHIRRAVFFFDDGMKWDGKFSVPDSTHPGQWIQQTRGYFPGVPTWPPKF